jgi:hypothetical protein
MIKMTFYVDDYGLHLAEIDSRLNQKLSLRSVLIPTLLFARVAC